jgi:hypothetical protein
MCQEIDEPITGELGDDSASHQDPAGQRLEEFSLSVGCPDHNAAQNDMLPKSDNTAQRQFVKKSKRLEHLPKTVYRKIFSRHDHSLPIQQAARRISGKVGFMVTAALCVTFGVFGGTAFCHSSEPKSGISR